MWYNKVVADISTLPDFIDYFNNELLSAKNEVKIFGNLENSRDFLHVQDLNLAISQLIKISGNQILNIGSGKATKLNELLQIFNSKSNSKIEVAYSDARTVDRSDYWLDISKMRQLTNWQPRINLKSGILEILNSI